MKPVIDRVLSRVTRIPFAGCWIFTGATNESGYGIVGTGPRGSPNDRAHRITYKHFVGEIPSGMFVCHQCDTPSCCNPEHLFLGTNQDNVNDMVKKGRNKKPPRNLHVVGSIHPRAKLHESQIRTIREKYCCGATQQELADWYGVARQTISKVVNFKRYKNA